MHRSLEKLPAGRREKYADLEDSRQLRRAWREPPPKARRSSQDEAEEREVRRERSASRK